MKTNTRFSLLAFILVFTACKKDRSFNNFSAEETSTSYANVPKQLWDYFARFEEEARRRGYDINLNQENITAEIMEISQNGVAGSCTYSSHAPNHIIIDQSFFNQTNDLYREMVIFHELGHCVLYRGHREETYPDGTCVSIMRSGLSGCFDNYRTTTRAAYMDELFSFEN
jgi:predicted metal-dependent hydrolase